MAIALLTACDISTQEDGRETAGASHHATQFSSLTPPVQLRAVDRSALFVELELSYGEIAQSFSATRQGASETWSTTLTVPTQTPFDVSVTWYDMADQERLDLVTSTRSFDAINELGRSTIVIDFDDFDSEAFDADSDSITNLQERNNGTSPFNASSPGVGSSDGPVLLSDCGSLPITTSQPSFDVSNPLDIVPGSLHQGMLAGDTATYYSIPLSVGQYRLVVDTQDTLLEPVGRENPNITIEKISETGESIETLINGYTLGRYRFINVIDISSPQTLRLKVRHPDDTEPTQDIYTFGVFDVNEPIPSPFFVECPIVVPVSSGKDVGFELVSGYANDVLLSFEAVEIRPYELQLVFSDISADSSFIAPRVELLDEYGAINTGGSYPLSYPFSVESEFSETLVFSSRKLGLNWIRFSIFPFSGYEDFHYAVQARLTLAPHEQ